MNPKLSPAELAAMIDHTALKAETTHEQIIRLCKEAVEYGFGAICINACWIETAKAALEGSRVKIATVIGFPLGAMSTKAKVAEAKDALRQGAVELDMVLNIGWLKSGMLNEAMQDMKAVARAAHAGGAILKVIFENCLLSQDEIVLACKLAMKAGVDFIKTSTGFNASGAKAEDLALMRKTVGSEIGVKAAGGIRSYADAIKMIEAGANRIGCSASVQIMKEARGE